ncbi:MAG: carbamoyl-phosphate synthase [Myxococcota bacterium]|nr:carbamoyl-phosphate synthase [Myxococcota bacterium]
MHYRGMDRTTTKRAILLCDAGHYGTLAAVRVLGRERVPVTVVHAQRAAPALWSRHVTQRVHCPPIADVERFAEWLIRFGERQPGHVLYATSDEICFVFSLYREELAKHFALFQPEFAVLARILDKGELLASARTVGMDLPDTWLPESEDDVERAAREADGPLLIKPRTQILLTTHSKGEMAPTGPRGLRAAYARFVRFNSYGDAIKKRMPAAIRPMLQRFYPEAMDAVYSLTGFRSRDGRHFSVLGANKVLQRPRNLGIGLCFEAAPVDPDLAAKAARLLEQIGYYGAFELEFIRVGDRWLLIDYNPRFYNQLALDVARGLPLPQLVYSAALGQDREVDRLMAGVPPPDAIATYAFCNQISLNVLLGAQRIFGAMSPEEVTRWRRWCVSKGNRLVDAVSAPDDPLPYLAEVTKQVLELVRDPRIFWRVHRPRRELSRPTID